MSAGGRAKRSGFTLLEMIVVLSLMAIMTGAVVLGLGAGSGGVQTEAEARRLADRLRLAADEVMITDRPLALDWDADGYAFVTRDPVSGRWVPDATEALGSRHELPGGLALTGGASAGVQPIDKTPSTLNLSGPGGAWRIDWDGLNAEVRPEGRT